MIHMVDEEMVWRAQYLPVHFKSDTLFADSNASDGIKGTVAPGSVPFVFIQPLEILRIDDGVFALCKRYPAERIAIAAPSVNKRQSNEKPRQPVRNRNRDGYVELNNPPRGL